MCDSACNTGYHSKLEFRLSRMFSSSYSWTCGRPDSQPDRKFWTPIVGGSVRIKYWNKPKFLFI